MKLYEITRAFRDIFDRIEDADEMSQQDMFEMLDAVGNEFEAKAEAIDVHIKELKLEAEAMETERKLLGARIERKKSEARNLETYLMSMMDSVGTRKVSGVRYSVSIAKSPDSIMIEDEGKLIDWAEKNDSSIVVYGKPSISKAAVKERISNGITIPFARLISDARHILIK